MKRTPPILIGMMPILALYLYLSNFQSSGTTYHYAPPVNFLQDSLALIALYNSTNGDSTWITKWNTSDAVSDWHGITLSQGRVLEISLRANNLTGSLPSNLGDLDKLTTLDLYDNDITGPIPISIQDMDSLKFLQLTFNNLTGGIPPEIGGATNLEIIRLGDNTNLGKDDLPLPIEIGNLSKLRDLTCFACGFSDTIPSEWSTLTNLTTLNFQSNDLEGPIPSWLPNNPNLAFLNLLGNELEGTIPLNLAMLTNLKELNLSGNNLSGTIPNIFGNLSRLRILGLGGKSFQFAPSKLTGTIPDISSLDSLEELNLSWNKLTGNVPVALSSFTFLKKVFLGRNELSETIPELGSYAALEEYDLSNNQLIGNIPPGLADATNLTRIDLGYNNLSGTIPSFNSTKLVNVFLEENNLTGSIPTAFGNSITTLAKLFLNNNQLSGTIPAQLGNLVSLRELRLSGNNLTGSIPSSFGGMTSIQLLGLSNNKLSGSIPPELGNLDNLIDLGARNNQLSGPIPPELGGLTQNGTTKPLNSIDFNFNNLSGPIPASFGDLTNLTTLELAFNDLTDAIPNTITNLGLLKTLSLGGNELSNDLPPNMNSLVQLTNIFLSYNQLTGPIPTFENNTSLKELLLAGNEFSGPIPADLGKGAFSNLLKLHLGDNNLTGSIPEFLGNFGALIELTLDNNQLVGPIPLGSWENLRTGALDILALNDNLIEGEIPSGFGDYTGLEQLYLNSNQFTGCIPNELMNLCDQGILVRLDNNPGLLEGDRFTEFCTTSLGACVQNYEPADAISLPLNTDPCGRLYRVSSIGEATTTPDGPFCTVAPNLLNTFVSRDVWYQFTIPNTGNVLIKNDTAITNIAPIVEVYSGFPDPNGNNVVVCAALDSLPFVLAIPTTNQVGNTYYLRVWDRDNELSDQNANGSYVGISAYALPVDVNSWELCDFPIELLGDSLSQGAGNRIASQFIVDFEPGTTSTEVDDFVAEISTISGQAAKLLDSCDCRTPILQLWGIDSGSPIDMEDIRNTVNRKSNVDTSQYNYILESREFQGNTFFEGRQDFPVPAISGNGQFRIVWQDEGRDGSRFGIYSQVFDANGSQVGAEQRLNSRTIFDQDQPQIAMNENGQSIAIWRSADIGTPSIKEIRGQIIDNSGNFVPNELDISDPLLGSNPSVAIDGQGNFIACWEELDANGFGIYYQRFENDGTRIEDSPPAANNTTSGNQIFSNVAMNKDGQFVMVWQSENQDGDGDGIYGSLYDNLGETVRTEFLINTTTAGSQQFPKVAIDSSGCFVVVWQGPLAGNNTSIFAQTFDSLGVATGSEIVVNSSSDNQSRPSVVTWDDGGFLITWESFNASSGTGTDIYLQLFDAEGNKIQSPNKTQVNTVSPEGSQLRPGITLNAAGQLVITWESYGQDNSAQGVFAKRYTSTGDGANRTIQDVSQDLVSNFLGQKDTFNTSNLYVPSTPNNQVKVAIIDTGTDLDHANLVNAIWTNPNPSDTNDCFTGDINGYDFLNNSAAPTDNDNHGAAVNGVIVNSFPDEIDLNLINLKFYENQTGSIFDAICAIYYAVQEDADIINLSWGFESASFPESLFKALQYASDRGVLIITSAGNTNKDNDLINKYPANLDVPNMMVVTATQLDQEQGASARLANYASFGANTVDLAAPGFVESTDRDNGFTDQAGTSMAAPLVARTAAIIKGMYPCLSAEAIKDCIESTVTVNPNSDIFGSVQTNGVLNSAAAIAKAGTVDCVSISVKALLQGPFDDNTNLMEGQLSIQGLVPNNTPFNTPDSETTSAAVTAPLIYVEDGDQIVDWIKLELRSISDRSVILATRSALLQRDGDIVDTDGISPVSFSIDTNLHPTCYVSVRHRNHLSIMTDAPVLLTGN